MWTCGWSVPRIEPHLVVFWRSIPIELTTDNVDMEQIEYQERNSNRCSLVSFDEKALDGHEQTGTVPVSSSIGLGLSGIKSTIFFFFKHSSYREHCTVSLLGKVFRFYHRRLVDRSDVSTTFRIENGMEAATYHWQHLEGVSDSKLS